MATNKHIDLICIAGLVLALLLMLVLANAEALGIRAGERETGYAGRLFDTSRVHTVDIVMDDWEGFIEGCEDKEYVLCSIIIDNEAYKNVAIRAKGNNSLTSVAEYGSDRYSFKIEFDHYEAGKSYYGLDKLCLNNLIQDNTYMKDYLVYQMMDSMGVSSPLCSYAYLTVNGEDWGLYLALEGMEDGFLQRNYGSEHGELYKPDSTDSGFGGNAPGQQNGDMPEAPNGAPGGLGGAAPEMPDEEQPEQPGGNMPEAPDGLDGGAPGFPAGENMSQSPPDLPSDNSISPPEDLPQPPGDMPDGSAPEVPQNMPEAGGAIPGNTPEGFSPPGNMEMPAMEPGGQDGPGGMSAADVKLQYIDDDPDSYPNIFDNAKTDVSSADEQRLISALEKLSRGEELESVLDIEQVISYFAVHNFVCNFDSYTGPIVHNYYLYEQDGRLSMLPWDYNLAFGSFQTAMSTSELVNFPIDSPTTDGDYTSLPMLSWIFDSGEYTELYHQRLAEFIEKYFTGGAFEKLIDETYELIRPYVEQDPTKFCTTEEFDAGVSALREFCILRAESVSGQLDGSVPSTSEGQSAQPDKLIDTGELNVAVSGTLNI